MAKNIRWEWYPAQLEKQLHRGEGTQRVINQVAGEIADDAASGSHRNNPKYDVEGYQGKTRYTGTVVTSNWASMWDERRDRLLSRAAFQYRGGK